MLLLAYRDREIVVIETCDGPIEIRFCCRDAAGLRIGIDAPSSMRILRHDGEHEWCGAVTPGDRDELPAGAEPAPAFATLRIGRQSESVPVFADFDDRDWWRHPDDARTGISAGAEPADPALPDEDDLWT